MGAFQEAWACAVFAFFVSGCGAQAALLTQYYPEVAAAVPEGQLVPALLFAWLAVFFSPPWGALTGGAAMNPAASLFFTLTGAKGPVSMILEMAAQVVGFVAGLFALEQALLRYPVPGVDHVQSAFHPPAGVPPEHVFLAEAAFVFVTFGFAFYVAPRFGALVGVVSAAQYIALMMYEGCTYSCTMVNPTSVFAGHALAAVKTGDFHLLVQDLERLKPVAPYAGGAVAGVVALAVVVGVAGALSGPAPAAKAKKDQ